MQTLEITISIDVEQLYKQHGEIQGIGFKAKSVDEFVDELNESLESIGEVLDLVPFSYIVELKEE